ncbi:MAG: methyl-accepting chemotaxis protein, partial [Treponema sp.]|nr:methyl-accepting chemotaxis protein [Treponema sp.]
KETGELIQESISRVNDGTQRANETAKSFEKIVSDVNDVSNVIDKILASSNAQSSTIKNMADGIASINQVVQSNSAKSEEKTKKGGLFLSPPPPPIKKKFLYHIRFTKC